MTEAHSEMINDAKPFLGVLQSALANQERETVYPCIRDLLNNGLDKKRFSEGEAMPGRQNVTHYLAAWCRHAGLTEEQSRAWLPDYCQAMLSSISRSSTSAIRHSAKSNLKYIYRSEIPFLCQRDQNPFHAHCSTDCPLYAEMPARLQAAAEAARQPQAPPTEFAPTQPVKAVHYEQFQAAMRLAHHEASKGVKLSRIIVLLEEKGLRTRTGRKWTYGILNRELAKWSSGSEPKEPD